MTKQILNALNSNIDFIQLKLFDFSDEKIDQEKIISERLNKTTNFENTNQKLFYMKITLLNMIFQSVLIVVPTK